MNKTTFELADPVLGDIAEAAERLLDATEASELRSLLGKLAKIFRTRYAMSLTVTVDVYDRVKERGMPLVQVGLSGFDKDKPCHFTRDSSPQKYVADGNIHVVPHDRCPKCWGVWKSKFDYRSCPQCGATLGHKVKVLLDTDTCPNCRKGTVSMRQPHCLKCGNEVDVNLVVWG